MDGILKQLYLRFIDYSIQQLWILFSNILLHNWYIKEEIGVEIAKYFELNYIENDIPEFMGSNKVALTI